MADKYVTVAGAGAKDGTTWANAFDWAAFVSESLASAAAGDTYWFAGGTHSPTGSYNNSRDGGLSNYIKLRGVKAGTTNEPPTISDLANGTDRPLIAWGSSYCIFDNYWMFEGLRMTSSSSVTVISPDSQAVLINSYFENTGLGKALELLSSFVYSCECVTVSGDAIDSEATNQIHNCYIHGTGSVGIDSGNGPHGVTNNIISGYDIGFRAAGASQLLSNNTIYDCATAGIDMSVGNMHVVTNNILDSCAIGILGDEPTYTQALVDYNNYHNNTTDVSGVTKGPNAMAFDPKFVDAANDDFSLEVDSELIGAGLGIQIGVG